MSERQIVSACRRGSVWNEAGVRGDWIGNPRNGGTAHVHAAAEMRIEDQRVRLHQAAGSVEDADERLAAAAGSHENLRQAVAAGSATPTKRPVVMSASNAKKLADI